VFKFAEGQGVVQLGEMLKTQGITGPRAKQFFARLSETGNNQAGEKLVDFVYQTGFPVIKTDKKAWDTKIVTFETQNPEWGRALDWAMAA
jgi:hypothetical protein